VKNNKLHILFLPSWYPSREHTTLGNFVQRHAFAVSELHQVVVVSAHESPKPEVIVDELGSLIEIRVYFKKKLPLFSYQKAMNKGIAYARHNYGDFDLAHVHVAYPAGVLAISSGLPYVVTEHFSGYHPQSSFKWNYGRKRLTTRILNRAYKVLPVSIHLAKAITTFGSEANMEQVSNVVDTSIFYPANKKPERFTYLHISTLEERSKNITGILRGFRVLEESGADFVLKIGGDGDLNELKAKIIQHGPSPEKVEIIPKQSIEGIAETMRSAHALVMFSHFENQPCTILEALCSGLPVISSDVGGIPEVIDESNGLLIPAGSDHQFAEGLQYMITLYDRFNAEVISKKASTRYSYQAVTQKLNSIYLSAPK
jgi:glycosyltransferase involved in cell wall biosynthesis